MDIVSRGQISLRNVIAMNIIFVLNSLVLIGLVVPFLAYLTLLLALL